MTEAKIRRQARYGGPGAPPITKPAVPGAPAEAQANAAVSNPFLAGSAVVVEGAGSVDSPNAFSDTLEKSRAEAAAIAKANQPTKPSVGAATKPAASADPGDPFGGSTPAANDPFGGGAGSSPAAGDPFGNF